MRGRDTARLDASLHDVIRSVPACGNPRIPGLPEYCDCSHARWSTPSNSRLERGPELRGGTKWSGRGSLRKVRQDAEEKLAFPQQLSGRMHVETWAGGCKSLNLRISRNKKSMSCVGVPSTPFFTPVLPGPCSDIRMKMEWKVMSKTEKSGVWFFLNARGMWRRRCFRCTRAL